MRWGRAEREGRAWLSSAHTRAQLLGVTASWQLVAVLSSGKGGTSPPHVPPMSLPCSELPPLALGQDVAPRSYSSLVLLA